MLPSHATSSATIYTNKRVAEEDFVIVVTHIFHAVTIIYTSRVTSSKHLINRSTYFTTIPLNTFFPIACFKVRYLARVLPYLLGRDNFRNCV